MLGRPIEEVVLTASLIDTRCVNTPEFVTWILLGAGERAIRAGIELAVTGSTRTMKGGGANTLVEGVSEVTSRAARANGGVGIGEKELRGMEGVVGFVR